MRTTERNRGRRAVLASVAAGGLASLGGCLGGETTTPNGDDEGDVEAAAFPDHPGDAPREPPAERRCDGPCGMAPAEYPDSNCQIAHEGGEGVFFESAGCLVAYLHDPTFYGGPESAVRSVWVRDFGTRELIDGTEAVFVLDYDEERHEEVMAHNPKPFAKRADAVAYVDSYPDLDAEDVVGLDAFGAEQAHRYRDYPRPDG